MSQLPRQCHDIQFDRPLISVKSGAVRQIALSPVVTRPAFRQLSATDRIASDSLNETEVIAEIDSVALQRQHSENVSRLLTAIHEAIVVREDRRQQLLSEMQVVAVELAVAAASHIVAEVIDREQFAVEKVIAKGLEDFAGDSNVTVSLHPADRQRLEGHLAQHPHHFSNQLTLRSDGQLARGDCRLEGPDGRALVSRVATKLSELRRHWLEGLDDAQTERRKDAAAGQPVKRFPDRRETA